MTDPYLPNEVKEFNPADLENLVRFCVQELESRRLHGLPPPAPFTGPGIYAIYYDGDHPLYQHEAIRSPDKTRPIYVGRARLTRSSGERPLYNRLRQHARSISDAEDLQIDDFSCRFLILHPVWVSTVEDLLIAHFDTLWNSVIKGFGIHDPGGKRHEGELPLWDTVHPGRKHVETMLNRGAATVSRSEIEKVVDAFKERRSRELTPRQISEEEVASMLRQPVPEDDEE